MNLKHELESLGYTMDPQEFRERVMGIFFMDFGEYTQEQFARRPSEGSKFCIIVRKSLKMPKLPEHVIMGTLENCRKKGDFENPEKDEAA